MASTNPVWDIGGSLYEEMAPILVASVGINMNWTAMIVPTT